MRRLAEHSGTPGHIYPLALLCYGIMPPPPRVCHCQIIHFQSCFCSCDSIAFLQVEKEIGERRVVTFCGVGLSVAPAIDFSDITAASENPEEVGYVNAFVLHLPGSNI